MPRLNLTLNARLQPMHRHDIEDQLDEHFAGLPFQVETDGGGTGIAENGETEYCDIGLISEHSSAEELQQLIAILENTFCPQGSRLTLYPEDENAAVEQQPLGQLQGLALYLNGTDLPDEVYAESDVNEVWDACERLLADEGEPMNYWEGDTETAIYCYGKNFQEMQRRLQPFLDEYPLCAQCRVVQIA